MVIYEDFKETWTTILSNLHHFLVLYFYFYGILPSLYDFINTKILVKNKTSKDNYRLQMNYFLTFAVAKIRNSHFILLLLPSKPQLPPIPNLLLFPQLSLLLQN